MVKKAPNNKSLFKFRPSSFVRSFIILMLVLFASGKVSAQQVLLSATSFDPKPGKEGEIYIGIDDVTYTGIQEGLVTSELPLATGIEGGSFVSSYQYAITDNPSTLDATRYIDISPELDYMYILSPGTTIENVLKYELTGLKPGSAVTVTVEYCNINSPANSQCNFTSADFKGVVNPIDDNPNHGSPAGNILPGQCRTVNFNGTADASGNMIFRINSAFPGACSSLGIKNISVYGEVQPTIYSVEGNEVCFGENVILKSEMDYDAAYQWQVNTGTGWMNIGTGSSQLYELSSIGSYQFRLLLTPEGESSILSDVFTVNAIQCCEINGMPASRETVFYENFGRLDLTDVSGHTYFKWDYSDPLNPVEVQVTTATPFRWQSEYAPEGYNFRTSGPPTDNEYTVASYLTSYQSNGEYQGAMLEWANNIGGKVMTPALAFDHSGEVDGGALFVNNMTGRQGSVLYRKTVENLCPGSQIYFECYINVFTNVNEGVDVLVNIEDVADASNYTTAQGFAVREQDGGGQWVRIATDLILTEGSNSVVIEIVNNSNAGSMGNDLVIDDIKVMACAPPAVNMFFDNVTLATSATLSWDPLSLEVAPSSILTGFYQNSPYYLFQWTQTPGDINSWQNLGTPQGAESFDFSSAMSHPAFAGLENGEKVYFRTIVASQVTFVARDNFNTYPANINDPCREYSVSQPIEATVDFVPCLQADAFNIISDPADQTICPDEEAVLSVGPLAVEGEIQDEFDITWYINSIEEDNIIKGPSALNSDNISVDYNGAATYFVRVRDKNEPNATPCYIEAQETVVAGSLIDGSCSPVTGTTSGTAAVRIISPNPAQDIIKLGEDATFVKVYNNLGELVLSGTRTSLDVSQLSTGIYQVMVTYSNGETIHHKMLKE